jgi:hypothetical protein
MLAGDRDIVSELLDDVLDELHRGREGRWAGRQDRTDAATDRAAAADDRSAAAHDRFASLGDREQSAIEREQTDDHTIRAAEAALAAHRQM